MEPPQSAQVLGYSVWTGDQEKFLSRLLSMVESGRTQEVRSLNLHAVWQGEQIPEFRDSLASADLVYLDGAPLAYWGKWLGRPVSFEDRHTAVDFLPTLLQRMGERGLSVFFLGGREADQAAIREWVSVHCPGLRFASRSGYFGVEQSPGIVDQIREFRPELLLVGMGMPRQELWLARHGGDLPPCTRINLGAIFDFLTGKVSTPPRGLGRWGLEWLWRWGGDPVRLTGRYFWQPLTLIPAFLRDWRRGNLRPLA